MAIKNLVLDVNEIDLCKATENSQKSLQGLLFTNTSTQSVFVNIYSYELGETTPTVKNIKIPNKKIMAGNVFVFDSADKKVLENGQRYTAKCDVAGVVSVEVSYFDM